MSDENYTWTWQYALDTCLLVRLSGDKVFPFSKTLSATPDLSDRGISEYCDSLKNSAYWREGDTIAPFEHVQRVFSAFVQSRGFVMIYGHVLKANHDTCRYERCDWAEVVAFIAALAQLKKDTPTFYKKVLSAYPTISELDPTIDELDKAASKLTLTQL